MEIVDAQVHINSLPLPVAVVAMDALGVSAVLVDEFASRTPSSGVDGSYLPDGSFRYHWPFSETAVAEQPDRFAYVVHYDPLDPELEDELEGFRSNPGRLGIRICPVRAWPDPPAGVPVRPRVDVTQQLRDGVFDRMLGLAERHGVPVFLHASNGEEKPLSLEQVHRVARQFPDLQVIADHSGVSLPSAPGRETPEAFAQFDVMLELAQYPNVAVKWCHAPRLSLQPYPWGDIRAQLHRVVEAFGPERVMWASDFTVDGPWSTWAETLFTLRDDPGLSPSDLEWLLGRSVRTITGWAAPAAPASRKDSE